MRATYRILIVAIMAMVWCVPALADTSDPAVQQIQKFYAVLTDTMKNGQALGVQGRFRKLQPAVRAAYDVKTAAAYSVGPAWTTLSATDQAALVAAFERFTVASYAKNFASYGGEQFVVKPTSVQRGSDRVVESQIFPAKGDAIAMNYRMREENGSWKIVDVYLNGSISQLATRRSDYASTIASDGVQGLIKKLNALSDELMKG